MLTRFHPSNLPTEEVTVISCGQNQRITVKSVWFCNTHSGAVSIYLHHVPSGSSHSDDNALVYDHSLASHATEIYNDEIYMLPGDLLTAHADTAAHVSLVAYAEVFES